MSPVLILIGMPGSGKTTVGQGLAQDRNYLFIDTDEFIEQELAKKTIERIFEQDGEEAFRLFEKAALEHVSALASNGQNVVVATGGGLPLYQDNFVKLSAIGTTIYLDCQSQVLAKRLLEQFECRKQERPLLDLASARNDPDNLNEKLLELVKNRGKTYEKAHHRIDTTNLSLKEVVERLKAF